MQCPCLQQTRLLDAELVWVLRSALHPYQGLWLEVGHWHALGPETHVLEVDALAGQQARHFGEGWASADVWQAVAWNLLAWVRSCPVVALPSDCVTGLCWACPVCRGEAEALCLADVAVAGSSMPLLPEWRLIEAMLRAALACWLPCSRQAACSDSYRRHNGRPWPEIGRPRAGAGEDSILACTGVISRSVLYLACAQHKGPVCWTEFEWGGS